MTEKLKAKVSPYEKYVDYKKFFIAVVLFALILILPMPESMLDVAVEYTAGRTYVLDYISEELFDKPYRNVEQWQVLTAQAFEGCMKQGISRKENVLKRKAKDLKRMGINGHDRYFEQFQRIVESTEPERIT